jgi:DNA-binding GntR family transcriptional regulator
MVAPEPSTGLSALVPIPPPVDSASEAGATRRSAAERVYLSLRQAILDGELTFGTALSEDAVAAQLGVSRTPVREALQNLSRDHLLEAGPRRTMIVRQPTPELSAEVLMMRIALESEAVARACEVATDESLDQIKLTVFRQERECRRGAVSGFLQADGEFHFKIAQSAELPLLHKTLVELHTFARLLGLKALETKGRMQQVIDEHERVLAALEARDPREARVAMRAHLESTGHVLQAQVPPETEIDPNTRDEERP